MLEVRPRKLGKPARWRRKAARRAALALRSRKEQFQRRGLLKWLTNFLFGDDVFISYSRSDGTTYAERLAYQLSEVYGLSCRLDLWETLPGREMPEKLLRALRRSRMLVVVTSPGAARSPNVGKEIRFYKSAHPGDMHIVPVDFEQTEGGGRTVLGAGWFKHIDGLPPGPCEPLKALADGTPSPEVVQRLGESFAFTRRNRRLFWASVGSLALVLLLLGSGVAAAVYARVNLRRAEEARGEAADQQAVAHSRRLATLSDRSASDLDSALLFSAAAYDARPTAEAKGSLLNSLRKAGQLDFILTGHGRAPVNRFVVTPDGRALISGGQDGRLIFWDLAERRPRPAEGTYGDSAAPRLALTPDGTKLATVGLGHLDVWDVKAQARRGRVKSPGREHGYYAVAALSDSRTVVTNGGQGELVLWDISDLDRPFERHRFKIGGPEYGALKDLRLAAAAGGARVAVGGAQGSVALWDVADPERPRLIREVASAHRGAVAGVALSPGGESLASAGEDGALLLWDTANFTSQPIQQGGPDKEVTGLAFGAGGCLLAYSNGDNEVLTAAVKSPSCQGAAVSGEWVGRYGQSVRGVALTPDLRHVIAGGADGKILFWRLGGRPHFLKGELGEQAAGADGVTYLAYSPDGRLLATASQLAGEGDDEGRAALTINDLADNSRPLSAAAAPGTYIQGLAFSPDGRALASVDAAGAVTLWEASKGWQPEPVPANAASPGEPVGEGEDGAPASPHTGKLVAFADEGRQLVTFRGQEALAVWDLTRRPLRARTITVPVSGESDEELFVNVMGVAASRDGSRVAVGYEAGVAYLLDTKEGGASPVRLPGRHLGDVRQLAFSHDGRWLVSLDAEGVGILWDLREVKPQLAATFYPDGRPAGRSAPRSDVLFNPYKSVSFGRDAETGGETLAISAGDEAVILWDLESRLVVGLLNVEQSGWGLSFSPDGKTLAAGKGNVVRLFDLDFAAWARLARRIANREPDAAEKNLTAPPAQP